MHLDRADKDPAAFVAELEAMRARADFDHTRFVFPRGSVTAPMVIGGPAYFDDCLFYDKPKFSGSHFASSVTFKSTRFPSGAEFANCKFDDAALFIDVSFGMRLAEELASAVITTAIADFTNTVFAVPSRVLFRRVNQTTRRGFRLRATGCNIEGVNFEDVNWHREWGRLTLQDELDLFVWSRVRREYRSLSAYFHDLDLQARYGSTEPRSTDVHGLIAVAYARLLTTCEGRHNYDDAEDAFCGMMEMKRIDPEFLPLVRYFSHAYAKYRPVAALGRAFKLSSWYRIVSQYGSSYKRALTVLLFLLAGFAAAYAAFGGLTVPLSSDLDVATASGAIAAGCLAAMEIATFQRAPMVMINSSAGSILRLLESLVIPSQVGILLLALRRRFKR